MNTNRKSNHICSNTHVELDEAQESDKRKEATANLTRPGIMSPLDSQVGGNPYTQSQESEMDELIKKAKLDLYIALSNKEKKKKTTDNLPKLGLTGTDPLNKQVGGNHYKRYKIHPITFAIANNLSMLQGDAIKYIVRFRDKNDIEDLKKALHCIELLIANEEVKL